MKIVTAITKCASRAGGRAAYRKYAPGANNVLHARGDGCAWQVVEKLFFFQQLIVIRARLFTANRCRVRPWGRM